MTCCVAAAALVASAGHAQETLWRLEDSDRVDPEIIEKLRAETGSGDLAEGEPRARVIVLFAPPSARDRKLDRTSLAG